VLIAIYAIVSLHSQVMSISIFNALNFSDWSEQVQFHLGVLDLDMVFHVVKPVAITDVSSTEEKIHYKALGSLMFMRMSIASNIKLAFLKTKSVK